MWHSRQKKKVTHQHICRMVCGGSARQVEKKVPPKNPKPVLRIESLPEEKELGQRQNLFQQTGEKEEPSTESS